MLQENLAFYTRTEYKYAVFIVLSLYYCILALSNYYYYYWVRAVAHQERDAAVQI